jgi:hypothetical protein
MLVALLLKHSAHFGKACRDSALLFLGEPDQPLKNPVGWIFMLAAAGVVGWRAYALIPSSFWSGLK